MARSRSRSGKGRDRSRDKRSRTRDRDKRRSRSRSEKRRSRSRSDKRRSRSRSRRGRRDEKRSRSGRDRRSRSGSKKRKDDDDRGRRREDDRDKKDKKDKDRRDERVADDKARRYDPADDPQHRRDTASASETLAQKIARWKREDAEEEAQVEDLLAKAQERGPTAGAQEQERPRRSKWEAERAASPAREAGGRIKMTWAAPPPVDQMKRDAPPIESEPTPENTIVQSGLREFGSAGFVAPQPLKFKQIRIPISQKNDLIGEGGVSINEIRSKSGSKIKVTHSEGEPEATITISGNVLYAEQLIMERMKEMKSMLKEAKWVDVPQDLVGWIIGPGGSNLHEISEKTGCKLKFVKASELDPNAPPGKQVCCIRGPEEARPMAEEMLMQKVTEVLDIQKEKVANQKLATARRALVNMANQHLSSGEPGDKKNIPCKWFLRGACNHGDRCGFSHNLDDIATSLGPRVEEIAGKGERELEQGALVRVHGLKHTTDLNGAEGTLEEWDASTGRWRVLMSTGEIKTLRPSNLAPVVAKPADLIPLAKSAPKAPERKGDWNCPACGDLQFAKNWNCRKCGAPHPDYPADGVTAEAQQLQERPREICQFFQRANWCKYGDECKYVHHLEGTPTDPGLSRAAVSAANADVGLPPGPLSFSNVSDGPTWTEEDMQAMLSGSQKMPIDGKVTFTAQRPSIRMADGTVITPKGQPSITINLTWTAAGAASKGTPTVEFTDGLAWVPTTGFPAIRLNNGAVWSKPNLTVWTNVSPALY